MTSLVSANAPSLIDTPPSAQWRSEVVAALGCSLLPPRSTSALRAMKSWWAARLDSTKAGSACSHAASSSQMNTMYSAISAPFVIAGNWRSLGEGPVGAGDPRSLTAVRTAGRSGVDDLADLDADPVLETGTAAGQAGGLVGVSGADHDIPGQGRGRRVAVVLAVQGTHRAHPVSHVGDRAANGGEPGAPLLVLVRLGRAVRLAAECENVLAHDLFPSAGPARSPASTYPSTGAPPHRQERRHKSAFRAAAGAGGLVLVTRASLARNGVTSGWWSPSRMASACCQASRAAWGLPAACWASPSSMRASAWCWRSPRSR